MKIATTRDAINFLIASVFWTTVFALSGALIAFVFAASMLRGTAIGVLVGVVAFMVNVCKLEIE